jgi:hypothetical protein
MKHKYIFIPLINTLKLNIILDFLFFKYTCLYKTIYSKKMYTNALKMLRKNSPLVETDLK